MALTPELIEQQSFTTSFRGFAKPEVEAFMQRIVEDLREKQVELDRAARDVTAAAQRANEANRAKEQAVAAAAQLPVPPALAPGEKLDDDDRFGELGDRIAALLRTAHDSADEIKATAEADAEKIKDDAAEELEAAKADAERIRAEAEEYKESVQAEIDAERTNLDAELATEREETEFNRELAISELADARSQVTALLAEAREQSEFIRHESEEIVRSKVQADMDSARRRMDIMRLTEQSSRDRLVSAQAELSAALEKLDAEPTPQLAEAETQDVIEEAEKRSLAAAAGADQPTSGLDEKFEPDFYESSGFEVVGEDTQDSADDDITDEDVEIVEVEAEVLDEAEAVVEDDDAEADHEEEDFSSSLGAALAGDVEDDDFDEGDDAPDFEIEIEINDGSDLPEEDDIEAELEEAEAEVLDEDTEELVAEEDSSEEDHAEEDHAEEDSGDDDIDGIDTADADADDSADAEVEAEEDDSADAAEEEQIESAFANSPLENIEVPDDGGPLFNPVPDGAGTPAVPAPPQDLVSSGGVAVPAALAGKAPASPSMEADGDLVVEDEDPLARLVREAMQRAVETARGDES